MFFLKQGTPIFSPPFLRKGNLKDVIWLLGLDFFSPLFFSPPQNHCSKSAPALIFLYNYTEPFEHKSLNNLSYRKNGRKRAKKATKWLHVINSHFFCRRSHGTFHNIWFGMCWFQGTWWEQFFDGKAHEWGFVLCFHLMNSCRFDHSTFAFLLIQLPYWTGIIAYASFQFIMESIFVIYLLGNQDIESWPTITTGLYNRYTLGHI